MSLYSYEGYTGTSATRYRFQPKTTFNYIEATTNPTIYASPSSINFKSTPGVPVNETVVVSGLNLSTGITASVSGQNASLFSVSPVSLGTSGGNLTVTYSPTAAGTHTAKITLSSTGAQDVEIDLNGSCVNEWTVCDGSNTNSNLPIYGNYAEQLQINQMIYPASMLTNLVGKNITSMTFHASSAINAKLGDDTWSVKLGTTNETSYGSNSNDVTRLATSDEVYLGYLSTGSNTLTITFANPFNYTGGNLVVDFQEMVTSGDFSSTSFYGETQPDDYTGFYSRTGTTNNQDQVTLTNGRYPTCTPYKFLPKVTFGFEDDTNPKIKVSPETLTISDSGTNNTFTVEGSNLGTDNVGLTQTDNNFTPTLSTTTGTYYDGGTYWGFTPANGDVNGTVAMNYNGRALSASNTVTLGNNSGASATFTVNYVADLYIVTDNGVQGNWIFTDGTQMTNNDGIYTATFTATVDNTYILFARKLGNDVDWGTRYVFGPNSGGDWWLPVDGNGNGTLDLYSDHPIKIQTAGSYIVTINANDGTFTITKMVPDLAIALDAPAQVVGGNDATVTATVTNTGETPVTGYTVTITADGNTILTQTVNETLAVGASATFNAEYATTAAQVGNTVNFAANVACSDDGDATNNNATASMSIINMPAPENVVATGDSDNQSATVTWDAPSILPIGTGPVAEGFDDQTVFEPFSIGDITATDHIGTNGGWTLYDPTGSTVWGVEDGDFPNMSAPHAWIVMNPSQATGINVTPHSPEQYM
jgi:hypothetical protein